VHCVAATPPPSAAPSSIAAALPRASPSPGTPLPLYCRLPSPVLEDNSLGRLITSGNSFSQSTTTPTTIYPQNTTSITRPAQTALHTRPFPTRRHPKRSASVPQHYPPNQSHQITPPQQWPTKDPRDLLQAILLKPTTLAPTKVSSTAHPHRPWAGLVLMRLLPKMTITAASSQDTTNRPCNTSNSPCTLNRVTRHKVILRRANTWMTEAEADRQAVVFVRVSWVRWLVAVVWTACSREVMGRRRLVLYGRAKEESRMGANAIIVGRMERPGRCDRYTWISLL
jgi:hypothetical protein